MFDILCAQKDPPSHSDGRRKRRTDDKGLKLEFEVDDFYALGSPIGLFQMLKGRTIAARSLPNTDPNEPPELDDPFSGPSAIPHSKSNPALAHFEIMQSSPKCRQLFNIFHPTDPISYRLEPLISPSLSALKPQPLPYTKKGIFAPVGEGLTGIGARVGQSVTGFFSNLGSGMANSLLNRSLGISGSDMGKAAGTGPVTSRAPLSMGGGTNVSGGVLSPPPVSAADVAAEEEKKRRLTESSIAQGEEGEHPPTLIDGEIETLYSGFQKVRKNAQSDAEPADSEENPDWQTLEERAKRLRREEAKVRAINSNGRVDYAIQEYVSAGTVGMLYQTY